MRSERSWTELQSVAVWSTMVLPCHPHCAQAVALLLWHCSDRSYAKISRGHRNDDFVVQVCDFSHHFVEEVNVLLQVLCASVRSKAR